MDSSPRRSDPDWATAPLLPDAEDPPPSRAWYTRLLDGAGVDDAAADDDDVSLESLLGNNDREDFVRESQMLMRLCYWVATNVVVYGAQRVACNLGAPGDAVAGWSNAKFFCASLDEVVVYSIASSVFVRITSATRSKIVFGSPWRSAVFVALIFLSGVGFSLLSNLRGEHSSLSTDSSNWSPLFAATLACFGGLLALGLGFHLHAAWRTKPYGALGLTYYAAPRVGVLLFLATSALTVLANKGTVHLHHYFIAWVASLFCCFDHPLSLLCLCATTGIYLQGVAAYGPVDLYED